MVIKLLEELFFHEKVARVVEHFVIHEKWEQNKKEMCEILEIYPELMKEILEKLVEFNLIEVTKQIARSKFYRINKQSNLLFFLRGLIQEFGMQRSLMLSDKELLEDVSFDREICPRDAKGDFLVSLLNKKAYNEQSSVELAKYPKTNEFIDRLIKEDHIKVFSNNPIKVCLTPIGKIVAYGEWSLRRREE